MSDRIRVALVDDHAILRQGLRLLIQAEPDLDVVGEASDGDGAIALAGEAAPDVMILDLSLPGRSGLVVLPEVVAALAPSGGRVLVLTMHDDPAHMKAVLAAGASGFVVKQAAHGLFGIADDVVTAVTYGGYSSVNAGIYTTTPNLWADGGWSGASWGAGWGGGAVANGDVLGFALDVDGKSLSIYQNNTLAAVLTWTSGPTALWPMMAFQFGPSAQANLGPSGCAYAAPAGHNYL